MRLNCLWIPAPQPAEARFQAHFNGYFSKRTHKPAKLKTSLLLKKMRNTQQGTIVSLCLAGRFSIVLVAGSWLDLHVHAWGTVRLFLSLDIASCIGSLIAEVVMLLSVCPASHCFSQPEFHSSGMPRYICVKSPICEAQTCYLENYNEDIRRQHHADHDLSKMQL